MKRVVSLLILVVLLLTACTPKAAQDTAAPPTRAAVLFSSLAEVWQAAGGEVAITVGESVARGLVPEGVPLVDAGAGKQIATELLLAERPDLVVYSPDIPAQAAAAAVAESIGIRTLPLRVESFGDYCRAVRAAAALTGSGEALEALGRAEEEVATLLEGKYTDSFLFIRAGQTAASTKVKRTEDHFAAAMAEELGLTNLADKTPHLPGTLSTEAILEADPDWLFFSPMGDETGAQAHIEAMLALPEWQTLTAVREGRTVILPRELFHYKPCSRWGEAYSYLISCLEAR